MKIKEPKKIYAIGIISSLVLTLFVIPFVFMDNNTNSNINIQNQDPYQPRNPHFAVKTDEAVDSDSNVDASANVGDDGATSYTDAVTQNDVDQIINEENSGGGSGETIENFIDQISDVDSSSDLGTHDVFADLQASDNTYNNISESGGGDSISSHESFGTGGSGATECTDFEANNLDWINTANSWDCNSDNPSGQTGATGGSDEDDGTVTTNNNYIFTEVSSGAECEGTTCTIEFNEIISNQASNVNVSFWYHLFGTAIGTLYFEWNESGSWVAIDSWTGQQEQTTETSDWVFEQYDLDSMSPSSDYGLRFRAVHTSGYQGDIALDGIDVDVTASSDMQMDLEMQFIPVANFTDTHVLAIETGSFTGSENINVTFWDGDSWEAIASDLTASTWNNFTVTDNVTEITFTIKLGGSTTTSDTVIDGWEIDSIILVSSGAGVDEDYVDNEDSDVDAIPDGGTLTTFANMQDIDAGDSVLTETSSPSSITAGSTVETFSGTEGTGHTINLPTDAGANEIRVCVIAGSPDGTGTVGSLTLPSGWSWIGTQTETGAFSTGMLSIIYRIWQSGDGNTLGLTYNNPVEVASICTTYEGVDTGTPLDQTVPAYTTGTGNCVSPSITTVTDDAWVHSACLNDGAPAGFGDTSIPSGMTLRGTMVNNPPSNGQNVGHADVEQASLGASGTKTWSNGASEEYVASTFALRPGSGSADYQLNHEVQFTSLPEGLPIANVSIYGGTQGSEALRVFIWNTSSDDWDSLFTDLAAGWNNISIIGTGWYPNTTITLNFNDTTKTSDTTTADVWNIDAVIIYLANGGGANYRLDWEHQITSVPQGSDNLYRLTIYGSSNEDIDIYLWNATSSAWNTTAIGTISSTEQWYNFSYSGNGLTTATITWNYRDTIIASDSTQSTLNIDYSGVYVYSLSVTLEAVSQCYVTPDETDYACDNNPSNVTADAGENFDIQIMGIDTSGTPVASGYIYFDTDSNPIGYTQLTTSWQTLYSNQAYTTTDLEFWMWGNIPSQLETTYKFNVSVRILLYTP